MVYRKQGVMHPHNNEVSLLPAVSLVRMKLKPT